MCTTVPHLRAASDQRARRASAALARLAAARRDREAEAERAAVEELVGLHLEVARAIAGRYRGRGIPAEDLEQVASLALIRAVHRYEPERGSPFVAYAVPLIRGGLRHHFRDQGWVVRPPRRVQELQSRVIRERDRAPSRGSGRASSRLAELVGATASEVDEALAAEGCFTPLSLDRPVAGADSGSVGETLPDEHDDGAAEARAVLRSPVRRLDARDRWILGMRFFEQMTQQEIAEALGVTQTQVSKLIARILDDLRAEVGDVDGQARREVAGASRGGLPHPA